MIRRIVKMNFEIGKEKDFEMLFESIKEKVRHQPGCQHLELWHDINTPQIYFTFSMWNSQSDLDAYRHTDLFAEIWKSTKVLFGGKPEAWSVDQIVEVK